MSGRPRYPKPDSNNAIVIRALEDLGGYVRVDAARLRYTIMLRGMCLTALNISSMPGQTDWIILCDAGWFLSVEVKEPGKENNLTAGEQTWAEDVGLVVASNADTVRYAILERMAE